MLSFLFLSEAHMGKNCDSKARGDVAIGVRCHEGTDQWEDPSPWGQLLLWGVYTWA